MYPKTDTGPPRPPSPTQFPKPRYVARVKVMWSSTKPAGLGTRAPRPTTPQPPGTAQCRGAAAHREPKNPGRAVAGNKLICTDVLGGRRCGRDRRAISPEHRGVPTGYWGLRNHMPVQTKPRNDTRSQVTENGRRWGVPRLTPSLAAGAEPRGAGGGRGHLHTKGLSWGKPRGSVFGRETPGLAPGSRAVLRARGARDWLLLGPAISYSPTGWASPGIGRGC